MCRLDSECVHVPGLFVWMTVCVRLRLCVMVCVRTMAVYA